MKKGFVKKMIKELPLDLIVSETEPEENGSERSPIVYEEQKMDHPKMDLKVLMVEENKIDRVLLEYMLVNEF